MTTDVTTARALEDGSIRVPLSLAVGGAHHVHPSVCFIEVRTSGGGIIPGSGWTCGSDMVVTARHVVDHATTTSIRVFPGHNGGSSGGLDGTGYITHPVRDYGVVFVRGDLGHLNLSIGDPNVDVTGFELAVCGYRKIDGGSQGTFDVVAQQQGQLLSYDLPDPGGLSGGPVLTRDGTLAVGIHFQTGSAERADAEVIGDLQRWGAGHRDGARSLVPLPHPAAVAGARPLRRALTLEGPVAALGLRPSADAEVCHLFGRTIGATIAGHLKNEEPVMVWIDDPQHASGLSFSSECILGGIASSLPRRVFSPQLYAPAMRTGGVALPGAAASIRGVSVGEGVADFRSSVLLIRMDPNIEHGLVACGTLLSNEGAALAADTWTYGKSDGAPRHSMPPSNSGDALADPHRTEPATAAASARRTAAARVEASVSRGSAVGKKQPGRRSPARKAGRAR